jgi:RNA polymerase sigma-70 factor (ECF subfamily)
MPENRGEEPDDVLAQRAAGGDEAAFERLFDRYYARVRGFAARLSGNLTDGEDIAQESFVRAARQMQMLREGTSFSSWIFRIASNLAKDRRRSESVRATAVEVAAGNLLEENHHADRVADALALLPEAQRAAVLLVYFEGLAHGEAAKALGCAETTVSWRLMLARRKLKDLLKP